jgi:hypothetical protein
MIRKVWYKAMEENKTRKELHIEFGQEGALGRKYNVWSGDRYDDPYIYENDEDMKARFDRWEEIEWEEKMKKKYGQGNK